MDFLDIAIVATLAYIVFSNLFDFIKFTNELGDDKKPCPPHDWGYNEQNKLQCKRPNCRAYAGEGHVPRGDENA